MKLFQPTICVDFDGVIHEATKPYPKMGVPKRQAREALQELIDKGYRVVVLTSRAASRDKGAHVREWLDYYDIPYHEVTAIKLPAMVYIDDRAIRFIDWPSTLAQVELVAPAHMGVV